MPQTSSHLAAKRSRSPSHFLRDAGAQRTETSNRRTPSRSMTIKRTHRGSPVKAVTRTIFHFLLDRLAATEITEREAYRGREGGGDKKKKENDSERPLFRAVAAVAQQAIDKEERPTERRPPLPRTWRPPPTDREGGGGHELEAPDFTHRLALRGNAIPHLPRSPVGHFERSL
ncbi:hypothetical protein HPB50_001697 [Hyalomma asiaticum]|uniref:Uncharacterized protein n=1 Tax=Hyalomma asiaticum TaxID=266040 RepID=A0ACB7SUE5_HYAAI|nr:hypothetical protein HPB50_001697 [Hyalomma asiaticum]